MLSFFNKIQTLKTNNFKIETLSGLTVALALVPEAVAFSLIVGVSPLIGLYSAFTIGLITSLIGGRPGMISGATGAVAVVLVALVQSHGIEYMFAAVILAGLLQVIAGALKLGRFIRLVPESVMYGFVNGLAIIIFLSQVEQFQFTDSLGEKLWITGEPLLVMSGLVLLTMSIIFILPKITKQIPAALVGVLTVSMLTIFFGIDTKTVGDIASIGGGLPPFHLPQIPFELNTLEIIFPYAVIIAGVGLIESLLTINLIDEITETTGKPNQECFAQGIANITTGFFTGMGGCAMIGQSLINISSGARARLSGITASLFLLGFILYGAPLIELIPMGALVGVMIMVALGTFEWASLKILGKMPTSDVLVMIMVTAITVFLHNLALAVCIGVIISAIIFAWQNAFGVHITFYNDEKGIKHYEGYVPGRGEMTL